ncbi:hypothetical protein PC9H_008435 [Pleurotus ostreatus]|uniref:NAD(P)-binding protein n=1 Tax=Pleurotus ostreatus TaxID=5322 RepID=A0A8H6ZRL7_PLEOS|nr:uncharacterized protein PC9H_008435 [Pleurotus ostreatus]KAF7426069.1 hypothetical protein PC9H_008435 [Pleurotus ostreatus]
MSYNAPSTSFNPVTDLPNMKGRVVLVTGSSSGIGFATLQHLSRMGAKVYMAVPDEQQTKAALERVDKEGREPGLGEVVWHELDLKDPRTAKTSAERFLGKETRLDLLGMLPLPFYFPHSNKFVLVNNAALISDGGKPSLNADGIQDNMAINYLGPFVFTHTLLPLLEQTAADGTDVRIVNVGSAGHKDVTYHSFDSKAAWNHRFSFTILPTLARYQYSKLAVHLWSNHLARRLTSNGSKVMLLIAHPGAILSDGAIRNLKTLPFPSFWIWLLGKVMHPQERGAFTTVFAGCAPRNDPNVVHGAYIVPPNVLFQQAKAALDEAKQDELFKFTKELLDQLDIGVQL